MGLVHVNHFLYFKPYVLNNGHEALDVFLFNQLLVFVVLYVLQYLQQGVRLRLVKQQLLKLFGQKVRVFRFGHRIVLKQRLVLFAVVVCNQGHYNDEHDIVHAQAWV